MPEIIYVKRSSIDTQKWDACIDADTEPQLYGYSWYLDAIADGQWDALIYGDYKAVFPLPRQRKWGVLVVYQPFFCQQLGLFSSLDSLEQNDFLKAIPKAFFKVHLQLRNQKNLGTELAMRTNYVLNLNRPYQEIADGYSSDCKKNLRKAERESVQIIETKNPSEVIDLYKKVWGPANKVVKEIHYQRFDNACERAKLHNAIVCLKAVKGEQILGRAIFLKSKSFLHYVCAAPTAEGKALGIMHSIIDHAIQQYARTNIKLDFEGSEIPGVAEFYQKFGPERSDYFVFNRKLF